MTQLYKMRKLIILKWVSPNSIESHQIALSPVKNLRLYGKERTDKFENSDSLAEASTHGVKRIGKISRATRKEAQAALLEYLHDTRNIHFADAENMSVNSPHFLAKLLQKIGTQADIKRSVVNFLRYHPINEFEPFFESLGLKPYEFIPLLPQNLMFLSDEDLLLRNYYVLCNYGIPRNKVGRIYKEAGEVFQFEYGVLALKLQAYERFGISRSLICKAVACSPYLLIGDMNSHFVKVLDMLKKGGLEFGWIEGHLSENSYDWNWMLRILNLFKKLGYTKEQLGDLVSQHPGFIFEGSGHMAFSLVGFLFKFGSSMDRICSIFVKFPCIQVWRFVSNLSQCFLFLTEIKMEVTEIGKIVCSHPLLLGSCALKKTKTLFTQLNVREKRLCKLIQDNPEELKKWVLGSKIEQLPNSHKGLRLKEVKGKFLLDVGMLQNPNQMEEELKGLQGRGTELQERFDCLIKAGLDKKDVCKMVSVYPHILNLKKEVIEKKIYFLVNELGYPVSYIITFPNYLCYKPQRVKFRAAMYNWLKEQGTVKSKLCLRTAVACHENLFLRNHVKNHSRGLEVWQELKKKFYPQL